MLSHVPESQLDAIRTQIQKQTEAVEDNDSIEGQLKLRHLLETRLHLILQLRKQAGTLHHAALPFPSLVFLVESSFAAHGFFFFFC